jgi:hypothetical protein
MSDKLQTFIFIMVFYIILSYIIGPLLSYYFMGRTLTAAGNGFIVGSILSIILWLTVGSKMVKK